MSEIHILQTPKYKWRFDLFGDNYSFVMYMQHDFGWWVRFWTKFFFGSKWERLD